MSEQKKDGLITYLDNCIDLTAKDVHRGDYANAIKHLEAALMALAGEIKKEREDDPKIISGWTRNGERS